MSCTYLRTVGIVVAVITCLSASKVFASMDSTGANGINSSGLAFTGDGIGIGQVEGSRSGLPSFDMAANSNPDTNPSGVFVQNGAATADMNIDSHAQQVAGIMISNDTTDSDTDGDTPVGVAVDALLFSSADNATGPDFDPESALAAQHIATRNGGDVRAINFSFGNPLTGGAALDGKSLLTEFVDWSAAAHDTLYVIAGNEGPGGIPVPTDNFNGMTVAYTRKMGGVYREVDPFNLYTEDAVGLRTSTDLLAPGDSVEAADLGGTEVTNSGTSFAAPHVTGTVALLQEFADGRIAAPTPGWDADARRHEVMKAVLLNSADKIKDTSGTGQLLGMEKTIVDTSGNNWLSSEAFFDTEIPLDDEMGAGQLNAKRAVQQFQPGEFDSDTGLNMVPTIGWDYGHTAFDGDFNRYQIDTTLTAGDYISITLAWDRVVEFDTDGGTPGAYDIGDTFQDYTDPNGTADDQINDLDIFLVPLNSFTPELESFSFEGTTEHLFAQIPFDDDYEIWVQQQENDIAGGQDYGLAWWYGSAPAPAIAGDFDGDGDVDNADLVQWEGDYGINGDSDADNDGDSDGFDFLVWQQNFGLSALAVSSAVPEPTTWCLAILGLFVIPSRRRYSS